MRLLALIVALAFCSSATAAPVLVTKDNYKSAADSPFDLAGGGFYLEDFEDGAVNTPGLSLRSDPFSDFRIIGPADGAVSVQPGDKVLEPTQVLDDLTGRNFSQLFFLFDNAPTQIGFVTTASEVEGDLLVYIEGTDGKAIGTFTTAFATNKFIGVTGDTGIARMLIEMRVAQPGVPIYQLDHLQYNAVPEPSTLALLAMGVCGFMLWACRKDRHVRWLRLAVATVFCVLALSPAVRGITTFGDDAKKNDPNSYIVKGGAGRDGVVWVSGLIPKGGSNGTGTLLPTGRHVLTAAHVVETGVVSVMFRLAGENDVIYSTSTRVINPSSPNVDLAIITLGKAAPADAETYEIYRQSDEIGKEVDMVGFGVGGLGGVGADFALYPAPTRRYGRNKIDDIFFGQNLAGDFDSGDPKHNKWGGSSTPVTNEAGVALNDSGGPALIGNKIVGVAYQGGGGEFVYGYGSTNAWMRVSNNAVWYDSVVPPVVKSVIMTRQSGGIAYAVPGGSGQQVKSVPVGGTNRIIVQFSEDVSTSGATVEVKSVGGSGSYPIGFSFLSPRFLQIDLNAPVQRSAILPGDKLNITFGNIKKPGTTGASLDSDWTNPTQLNSSSSSNFPSGDGTPGGSSFQFHVIVLPADFNGDNIVNSADLAIIQANMNGTGGKTYAQGDATGDGFVDFSDLAIYNQIQGTDWSGPW